MKTSIIDFVDVVLAFHKWAIEILKFFVANICRERLVAETVRQIEFRQD